MNPEKGYTVMVVDDDPFVLESISLLLQEKGYATVAFSNAEDSLVNFRRTKVDIVLTDIKMPNITGIELIEKIHEINPDTPVILMTGQANLDTAIEAIKKNASDFITKPYNPDHLFYSIEKAAKYIELVNIEKDYKKTLEETVEKRTRELSDAFIMIRNMSWDIIKRLTSVAEFRDIETGAHISRIGFYAQKVAEAIDMPADFVESISFASPMHDIGKIGIPDNILLKPSRLSNDEFDVMKTHTSIGKQLLSGSSYPIIKMAETVALNHHEKWDGSGYPQGLKGEEIPVEGRIVMLADVYDALRSSRPYRKGLDHEAVFRIITEGDAQTRPEHFDPTILNVFVDHASVFDTIFNSQ